MWRKQKKILEIEERILNICSQNDGRYYKTQAKNVKFLREKGYKVTSFENALKFLKLTKLWNINKMNDETKRINEEIKLL